MQTVPIAILGIIVLVIAIFFLIGVEYFYKKIESGNQLEENQIATRQEKFFEEVKPRSIYLMGSSHVGTINATKVKEFSNAEKMIYNLAIGGDDPINRAIHLEMILKSNPEIILYGISYRDFRFPQNNFIITNQVLDSNLSMSCYFQKQEKIISEYFPTHPFNQINLILRDGLKIDTTVFTEDDKRVYQTNTPFYKYRLNEKQIVGTDFLNPYYIAMKDWNDPIETFCQINSIKEIISKANEHGINIILVTTPLHSSYLELITNSQKDNFEVVKKYLTEKYNVKIFEFENRYSSIEDIWYDSSHLLVSKNGEIFNRDVAKILDDEQ